MIWEVRRRSGKVESQLAYDQNRKWTKVKAGSRETDRKQIVHGRNLLRWGLDRRAENPVANVVCPWKSRGWSRCLLRTCRNPDDKLTVTR